MSDSSPLSSELIAVLRCPETKQSLHLATPEQLAQLPLSDEEPDRALENALIREDGRRAYPVRNGFPILLLFEAIELAPATAESDR